MGRTPLAGPGAGWLLRARLTRSPVAFYERMLRVLARRGRPRPPTATAREFASSLVDRPQWHGPVADLTALYERVRFGGQPLTSAETRRVAQLLNDLAKATWQ